ncbi:MAG: hypothetical protein DWH82_00985 [Planctomycetota bacterium]|nr:MAG: hypothetical protein DWH82_00985 [Planctomycetota bacterium]
MSSNKEKLCRHAMNGYGSRLDNSGSGLTIQGVQATGLLKLEVARKLWKLLFPGAIRTESIYPACRSYAFVYFCSVVGGSLPQSLQANGALGPIHPAYSCLESFRRDLPLAHPP